MVVGCIPDKRVMPLQPDEWRAVEIVEHWLRAFRNATTTMSTTKAMTLSMTHAIFRTLEDELQAALAKLPPSTPSTLKEGLINAHRKLSDYYQKIDVSPFYIWASSEYLSAFCMHALMCHRRAVLDPRISLKGLQEDAEDEDDALEHITDSRLALERYFQRHYAAPFVAPPSVIPSTVGSEYMARYRKKARSSGPRDELSEYFEIDTALAHQSGHDALQWWRLHEPQFPQLSKLARDIFSIPGTEFLLVKQRELLIIVSGSSVAVERIFSGGRAVVSLRRASLKPDTIRALMLGKQAIYLQKQRTTAALRGVV